MSFLDLFAEYHSRISRPAKRRRQLNFAATAGELLEDRVVLYAATGNAWPDSRLVTISFVPDGTNLGGVTSDLNSAFDGKPVLAGRWQDEIKRAAQDWAKVTNLNFAFVGDSGAASGSGAYQQGDPTFGDIRIGGFNFGSSTLASATMPPPINNWSIAGDINFNTAQAFGIGTGYYDLYTVAVHEIGHALGLNHSSTTSTSVMWATYNGVKQNLVSDDVSGIQSIYSGTRDSDTYETAGGNNNINDAKNIAGDLVRAKKWAIIDGLDITSTSDVDFYRLAMPGWAGPTLVVKVQSAGFSQLAPKMTIYDKDKTTVLGTINGSGQHGTSLSLSISGVTGSDVFYIKIEAAESNSFGVGAYGITLDVGADSTPVLTPPNTMKANGNPISSGGGSALGAARDDFEPEGGVTHTAPTINDIPPTGKIRSLTGTGESNSRIIVYIDGNELGSTIADDAGLWTLTWVGKRSIRGHQLTARISN